MSLRAPLQRRLFALLVLAAAVACSPQPTQPPQLLIGVRPTTVPDDGGDVDVQLTATDGFGKPGKGEATLTTDHGFFGNGTASITLTLDAAGSAFTTFACDAHKDRDCFTATTLHAVWAGVSTGKGNEKIDVAADRRIGIDGCGFPEDAGAPPIVRKCAPPTDNECDGTSDAFLSAAGATALNSTGGNGYDDDCDGLVDEGCACAAKGTTKECWLVPATQLDPATGIAPGWCATNSKGSVDCAGFTTPVWSGQCRGASPPADHDICSLGDYNCDGLQRNSDLVGCRCAIDLNCPKTSLVEAPFPDPKNLTGLNGAAWLPDAGMLAQTKNWRWTIIGGDCDNVLPNPTFALYKTKDSSTGRVGAKSTVVYDTSFDPPRYLEDPSSTLRAVRGNTGDGLVGATVFPAFGLSGDYVVQGEFDLGSGHYACTQKVEVRAPGLRAELCWDTAGNNDVDLHVARLQDTTCGTHGWNSICQTDGGEDCYFADTRPSWGYLPSDAGVCHGWGSKQSGPCNNPRLDADNISCTRTTEDPVAGDFCGPENINIDAPRDGDRFAIGALYYGSSATIPLAHPHVNLYCNGARLLSTGFNPVTGQIYFPALRTTGGSSGDFWTVATVTARVDAGVLVACDIETIPSRYSDSTRDGFPQGDAGTDFCVDSSQNLSPAPFTFKISGTEWVQNPDGGQSADAGGVPPNRDAWCRH